MQDLAVDILAPRSIDDVGKKEAGNQEEFRHAKWQREGGNGVQSPGLIHEQGAVEVARLFLLSFIDPFGTLWFIYLLPVFFVFIKLTRRVPVSVIWLFGAALEIAHINTGWMVPDEFAARFVYCYTGYIFAKPIFALTARAQSAPLFALAGLLAWGLLNGTMVYLGYERLPFVSLALGLAGVCAVVTAAAIMAKSDLFKPLRYCGRNSIVIYLAFFLPMAATCAVLLGLFWAVRGTPARFLFERPSPFWLAPPKRVVLQPAE